MALSTQRELHIDTHLTNLAINFRPQNFIADQIAPIVPVAKESDSYPVFSRYEAFMIDTTFRSRGAESRKITRSVGSSNYMAKNYALGFDVAIEDLANMDDAFRGEMDLGASQYVLSKLGLDYEKRVLTLINTTTAVGTTFVVASKWNAGGTLNAPNASDPFASIMTAIETVQSTVGQRPNSILFGWQAWAYMVRNVWMRALVQGLNNGGGVVTRQQVQDVFGVDRILISNAFWHTGNEGQQGTIAIPSSGGIPNLTNSIADRVYVYYAPMAPSRQDPSWLYSFRWNNPQLPAPLVVARLPYDARKKIETIEASYYQDERIVGQDYAACIAGVGSAQANGL